MCRSLDTGGRRCPSGCAGSGGCEYVDERMRKAVDPEAETQKFSQVHKEVVEELKDKHPKEDLERAVGPQQFDNFHKVVSKMINQSDMTEHDKMIARKKWNRAEQEVSQAQVTTVTLKTWEKMLAGTALFLIDRIDSKGKKVQWRQITRALKATASVREYGEHTDEKVVPEGFSSYDDFIQTLEDDEWEGGTDWEDAELLDNHHTPRVNANEIANDATVFDGKGHPEGNSATGSGFIQENSKKSAPFEPVSFARRPKGERGAHKAGKPVKEETVFDEPHRQETEDTSTRPIPVVTATPIHESKLSERLNAIDAD